jgi:hypothetical protein
MDTADSYSRQQNLHKSIAVSDIVFALIPQPLLPALGEGEKACTLDLLRESSPAPLTPQFWGEQELEVDSKSPRIGGFRGLSGIRAGGLFSCSTKQAEKFKSKLAPFSNLDVLLPSPSIGRGAGGEGKTLKRSPTR